ncbi:MAG: ComF family protein [Lachnospiraceae bacterium]|nr:ComF family protein [Lachnospiraceae bacterium]
MPTVIGRVLLDLVYPRRCALCDGVLPRGQEGCCEQCALELRYLKEPLCLKCGKPVGDREEYCHDCSQREHEFREGAALFEYGCIKASLYRYKYGGRQEYAAFYARHMAARMKKKIELWRPQALVPVPMYPGKKRQRGYNQAELLAKELSLLWKIPVEGGLVLRCRNTRPMKEIEGKNRQNNLKKAFKIGRNDVKLNTIVIIDDIYTTGSTADAVSRVCKAAGIRQVYVLSLAIGKGF